MISSVYDNKNSTPVNKQAVKEFFKEPEYIDHPIVTGSINESINIDLFKRPTFDMELESTVNQAIDFKDYQRIANSLKKLKDARPYKLTKLIRHIQHMSSNRKKKYAMLIITSMCEQRFIKIINNQVIYC